MRGVSVISFFAITLALLNSPLLAQDTNAPKTKLEFFELQVGTVILKGSEAVGTVALNAGAVSVTSKESIDMTSGRKSYGMAVTINDGKLPADATVIDYDELNLLLDGLDRLSKMDWNATSLPEFEATFITRGDLRISVYSSRHRPGSLGMSFRSNHNFPLRVSVTPEQMAQFRVYVAQAKSRLDALVSAK